MRSSRRLAAAAVGAGMLILSAGCGGSAKPTPSAQSSSTATASPAAVATTSAVAATTAATTPSTTAPSAPTDPIAQAKSGALDAYNKVVELTVLQFATNKTQPDLPTYAKDNAYAFFRKVQIFRLNHNVVYVGKPQSSPTVTEVDMNSKPISATITDCYGGPGYTPVFASDKDGEKKGASAVVAGTSTAPHPITAILEDRGDHWVMINYEVSDKTC